MKKEDIYLNQPARNIFHYKGMEIENHHEVYEPAEDTFLLLDTIVIDKNDNVLEIGTGCGIIALECARHGADVICTDINPYAIKLAERNYNKNKDKLDGVIDFRCGDLFSVLRKDEKFDVIIFNPPYLPTHVDEQVDKWFDVATDGGSDGLKIINRFINDLNKYLKHNGHAYFVFSSFSNSSKLNYILTKNKLNANLLSSKWFDDERIEIYCINPQ